MRRILKVSDDYRVDALLAVGTHPPSKEYPQFFAALQAIGVQYQEETVHDGFFGEVKSLLVDGRRLWFDVV